MTVEPTATRGRSEAEAVVPSFTTGSRTITQSDVDQFADLTGDRHPQHIDAQWAESSHFGGLVAHGMLVLSCATGLVPLDPERVVALRRSEATFKRAVKPGDAIHVEAKLISAHRIDDGHQLLSWRWRVVNQDGQLVVKAMIDVVWRDEAGVESVLGEMAGNPGVLPL